MAQELTVVITGSTGKQSGAVARFKVEQGPNNLDRRIILFAS